MDFAKQRHKLPRLKSYLKDFSALEDIARDTRLGVLPESLKNFKPLEDIARQITSKKTAPDTVPTFLTDYRTKQVESESNLYHQRSEEKKRGFFSNQGCDKKTHETSFFSNQQEQFKQSEFLKNSQKKRSFFEYAFKKMRKSSKKKLYTCDKVVGGAKEHGKLNGNSLYKDPKCAQIMHRYATAKKPSESLKTMAKELTEILGVNISGYQAAYQYQLYRKNVEKPSTHEIKKDEHKSSTICSKKIQSKIPFKKKQKSPSTSPVSLSGIMKQLSALQKQTNLISQQQNQLMNFIYQKLGKNDKDIDVMQHKSQGFKETISLTSEKSDDDAMSWKSAKFEEDALSFTSAKSNHSEQISSLNSSQISSNSQDFDDAHSNFSVDSKETVPSDDANSVSLDRKNNKKVTFKDANCDSKSKNELDVSENEDSFVDSKTTTEVNKKGQILTDYSIRKNSKLKPMVVVNQNNMWYSYIIKSTGIKSQRYQCNLCPRHSHLKSKGIMKNKQFWVHPKHSPLCKPMTKEELEALQIDRDIREDVSKGYRAQDSYVVGYKKAVQQGIEKHLPSIENVSKSLDRWKAKTFPGSKKGKVAEEHKILLNGEKYMIFEDEIVSVFMSDEAAKTMANCRILVADPTFKTSPQGFMQTLYIHGLVETANGTEWRPLLMAPIDSKNEEDYLKVVNAIKKRWQELGVKPKFERFHTDYEKALFNAFAELDGIEKMFGCLFHYDKAVLKAVKAHGLFGYYFIKKGNKIPEYKAIKKWVRTIMALPMLPKEDIPKLAEELLKIPQPPPDSKVKWPTEELEKLKNYIETEWLSVFKEDDNNKWCFYGLG